MNGRICGMLILSILAIEITNKIAVSTNGHFIFYVLLVDSAFYFFFARSPPLINLEDDCPVLIRFWTLEVRGPWLFGGGTIWWAWFGVNTSLLNIAVVLSVFTTFNINNFYGVFNSFANFIIITIYLAIKYARNSKYMVWQLSEINKLSQEKQQMLATQNEKLEAQVIERTSKLNQSLKELKETQSTAYSIRKNGFFGWAHCRHCTRNTEPAEFVNNFSEVSMELADDLKEELTKIEIAPKDKENLEDIANDLIQNQEKIISSWKKELRAL